MRFPSWGELFDYHCGVKRDSLDHFPGGENPLYEQFSQRRYNYATGSDTTCCRLVFLKEVLDDPVNKTLVRNGRFIWCRELKYEGLSGKGFRQISFSVDNGKKRFIVAENNILCLPSDIFVSNNRYFRAKGSTFTPFSSVFGYRKTIAMMCKNSELPAEELREKIKSENPFRPGTLVSPRLGYFFPDQPQVPNNYPQVAYPNLLEEHPCGIILGRGTLNDDRSGREFYRVRFGGTTYERVHPVQLEIVNEV